MWRRGFSPAGEARLTRDAIESTGGAKAPLPQLERRTTPTSPGAPSPLRSGSSGALAGLGVMLVRVRKTRRIVAGAGGLDVDLKRVVRELCVQVGVRRTIDARWSSAIDAPMVVGLLRPVSCCPPVASRHSRSPGSGWRSATSWCTSAGHLWLGCVPALAERLFFFTRSRSSQPASTCWRAKRLAIGR